MTHTGEKSNKYNCCVQALRTKTEKKRRTMIHTGKNLINVVFVSHHSDGIANKTKI